MKNIYLTAFAALMFVGAPASAQQAAEQPSRDADGKITDKEHPDYIRCRTESVIGSRAKKKRVCLTNSEWALVERNGRAMANQIVTDSRGAPDGQGF